MLSAKLIQLIEDHWEPITRRVLLILRTDPRLTHFRMLPEADLHERIGRVCKNLGRWLDAGDDQQLAAHYEDLGRRRFQEAIPLDEVVHASHVIKNRMIDFIRDQGIGQTSMDLYAQEELEHRVGLFFDAVVYHLVRGYDQAWRRQPPVAKAS
jgi:hypothetical protein